MKKFLIGEFQLGWRMVSVWADPEATGAWFNLCRQGQQAQMTIGMDYSDVAEAHGCLVHEAFEMCMDDMCCCYRPKAFVENASDIYRFMFDHNQHTEISSRVGFFLFSIHDKFKTAHKKCRDFKKSRKTRK